MTSDNDIWDTWNRPGGPRYPHEKVVQFMFRNYPPDVRAETTVLDLGCGSGVHAAFLAKEGFRVFGTDISDVGIANTRERMSRDGLSGEFSLGSADHVAHPDAYFDCIISIGVLDCAGPTIAAGAVTEVIRLLRSGGKAFLCFASHLDFRVQGDNPYGLHGFSVAEVENMIPTQGLATRWIDRYITTQRNQAEQQNDFLITLEKE